MGRYSIGRTVGTWTNITPPIRRLEGDRETHQDDAVKGYDTDQDESYDDDTASLSLSTSSMTSLESLPDIQDLKTASVVSDMGHTSALDLHSTRLPSNSGSLNEWQCHLRKCDITVERCNSTQAAYASGAIQTEINVGISQNPSLDPRTQQNITAKYRALHQRVQDEGFYECQYIEYGKEAVRYLTIFAMFLACLRSGWYLTSACSLGLFWVYQESSFACRCAPQARLTFSQHQIMFTAHDAGHRAITHNLVKDTLIGIFIADLCCGLSIGWWKSSHNVHHLITNHPVHRHVPQTPKSILTVSTGT